MFSSTWVWLLVVKHAKVEEKLAHSAKLELAVQVSGMNIDWKQSVVESVQNVITQI